MGSRGIRQGKLCSFKCAVDRDQPPNSHRELVDELPAAENSYDVHAGAQTLSFRAVRTTAVCFRWEQLRSLQCSRGSRAVNGSDLGLSCDVSRTI